MSTLQSYTSGTRPSASGNTGLCIFRSDTNAIEVSDGTNYLTYNSDGVGVTYPSNSYSVELDGTNDYIDTGDKFDFIQKTCNFSITFWVKLIDHTSTAANQFLVMSTYGGGNIGLMFWYDNRFGDKKFRFLLSGIGNYVEVNNGITDNNWHHIALTCANGGDQKVYRDGSLIASGSAPSPTTSTATHNLLLGAAINTSTSNISAPMNGYLDEVAIFNRELTSSEIDKIRSSPYSYVGATSIYRFENNANDSVGTNNGTNFNATFETSEKPY